MYPCANIDVPSANGSNNRSEAIIAPIGEYPEVRPLAQVMMSGTYPKSSHANIDPIRPNAQITSSETSSTSYSSQICRTRSK